MVERHVIWICCANSTSSAPLARPLNATLCPTSSFGAVMQVPAEHRVLAEQVGE